MGGFVSTRIYPFIRIFLADTLGKTSQPFEDLHGSPKTGTTDKRNRAEIKYDVARAGFDLLENNSLEFFMIRRIDVPIHTKNSYRDTALVVRDCNLHTKAPFRRVILPKEPARVYIMIIIIFYITILERSQYTLGGD